MLHLLGLLLRLIQFLLRVVLSQISWFPLPWRSYSCFLILNIEHRTESLTLSRLASFPHRIVFLQKLCSTIYGPLLEGVSQSTKEQDFYMLWFSGFLFAFVSTLCLLCLRCVMSIRQIFHLCALSRGFACRLLLTILLWSPMRRPRIPLGSIQC